MNLFSIFEALEKEDPEIYERFDTRRKAMSEFGRLGKKVALAALPLAMGSMFTKAYGKTMSTSVTDVLNYALALEHLEHAFYRAVLAAGESGGLSFPDVNARGAIREIADHEFAHASLLAGALGKNFYNSKPKMDLTGGGGSGNGPFKRALTDYDFMLQAAQTFEDTGVRAYKGQVTNLMGNNEVLRTAVKIHSVEARHASKIRDMRFKRAQAMGQFPEDRIEPWITRSYTGVEGPDYLLFDANYDGEANTNQGGVNVGMNLGTSEASATEAYDEPLSMAQVLKILGTPGAGAGTANAKFFY